MEVTFEPFASYRHWPAKQQNALFWQLRAASGDVAGPGLLTRCPTWWIEGRGRAPEFDTVTVRTLCTNRELPAKLQMGNEEGDFEIDAQLPVERIIALRKPSPTVRPVLGSGSFWRLISHLSLNYLSLIEDGREALQEILRLYSRAPGSTERQIDGIIDAGAMAFREGGRRCGIAFVRGTRVNLLLDEEYWARARFSAVIDRFLGGYVSLNSFVNWRRGPNREGRCCGYGQSGRARRSCCDPNASGGSRRGTSERRARPYEYRFFQAVRLLQGLAAERTPVGRFSDPSARPSASPP